MYVKSQTENQIATITFFHPMGNSLPGEILTQMAAAIQRAGDDPGVKVIVLRSDGDKAFCAGASFDELVAVQTMEQGQQFFSGFANVINAIRKVPQFVVARVHAKAVGGGVGIASAADYTLAHESASVKLSELAIGIGPFVIGPAVERKAGTSAYSALAMNATAWYPASWAREKGIYSEVHVTIPDLDQALDTLATRLASSNPEAMFALKKIFWQGTEHWDTLLAERAAISGRLVLSEFTRNAIARFKAGSR